MIPETQQTQPKKTSNVVWIVLGLIIICAIGFAIALSLRSRQPQVEVLGVDAERYGMSIYSDYCRATITATIRNSGDVDASVDVQFTASWAGESHTDVRTVVVKAHSTSKVTGDVQATTQWYNYKAEIIEVRPA